jgi:transcriptional regulator with XRE-family HTH domain
MYDLGLRIKEIRKKRGLSQRELAKRINKSYSVVCGYESNAQLPPLDVAISIAAVLNVSLDYLVGNEETSSMSLTCVTPSQREIIEALLKEFSKPTSGGKELSPEQIQVIQKIFLCFSE